ncbi:MAG: protein phosphatase 2C domain-containing protein [Oscillospiraceae bacterium]|nr:protein phosphatase 2C domain-containing protein [Oscillospiraceae bacterium]
MSVLCSGYSRQCANQLHVNQDKFGALRVLDANGNEVTVALVADGVSLGYQGKFASYNTVLWLLEWGKFYFPEHSFDMQSIAKEIQDQMVQYNHFLNDYSDMHSDKDTCCTVCGIVTDGNQLLVFNAGDSRLYEMAANGQYRCMTQDDKAEDGYSIAMHIGGKNDEEIRISFSADTFHADSLYVLCSDGFYKRCDFQGLAERVFPCNTRQEIVSTLDAVVEELVNAGENDDITALVIAGSDANG